MCAESWANFYNGIDSISDVDYIVKRFLRQNILRNYIKPNNDKDSLIYNKQIMCKIKLKNTKV